MNFREGDQVVHWTHGLGKVVRVEERVVSGPKTLYYAVEIRDLTIWVPADAKLSQRLRPPTTKSGFRSLLAILSGPAEKLPVNAYRKKKPLNDNDQALLKQSQNALIAEWGHALSLTPAQAEAELHHVLTSGPAGD
jgi:RNA polymerase-interacting CarD/CdnL/TRCF family regulator